MIVTRLTGGLGNQMFQYANARIYQRDDTEPIYLDTRMLRELETDIEKIIQRPYALDIFKYIKAKRTPAELHQLFTGTDLLTKIRRKLFKLTAKYVVQNRMAPIGFCRTDKTKIYLEGDFQSSKDFKHLRKSLLSEFQFPALDETNDRIKQKILSTPDAVSLHVRRGDYLSSINKDAFTSVNLNYYKNAIDTLLARLGVNRLNTFIFTDDPDWVREHLNGDHVDINIVKGNYGQDSWKDMLLMTFCTHHIIANSSFSWWGAWLANENGINLAPKHWYRPNTMYFDIEDIVPSNWGIVDYIIE